MSSLVSKLETKQVEYRFKSNRLVKLEDQIEKLEEEIAEDEPKIDTLENRVYGCKLLVEKLVGVNKNNLETFLTFAVQKIFTDRNYIVRLDFKEDSKRPALELILEENGIAQEITDAVGGGILSTLGLLLQIYYIEVYGLTKVMFIDEGLKEVSKANPNDPDSKDYLTDILGFLKWMSQERGYTFVIVTHDTSVVDMSDRVYTVKNGQVTLSKGEEYGEA